MSSANYKVIFEGNKEPEKNKLSLTFKSIPSDKPINIPAQFILDIKKLSEKSPNIVNFQNIEEVVKIGKGLSPSSFNYFFALLYTLKSDSKKEGFLMGNIKKLGDTLIGIWPFNTNIAELSYEVIVEKFNNLIKKPHEYSNICLIS